MISKEELTRLLQKVKDEKPLVHCITNHISINDCANALLAMGTKPIMAEHKDEAAEITAASDALVVNLGNISDSRMAAIRASGKAASEKNIPCIIDAVGVGCSKLRLNFLLDFIENCKPCIIKGNESEIRALCGLEHHAKGIDSGDNGGLSERAGIAQNAAKMFDTTVLMSGKTDIISDGEHTYAAENGHEYMSLVTGTGCLLGAVTGAFLTVAEPLEASVAAAVAMGIAGEYAAEICKGSISRFHGGIIDGLFNMNMQNARYKEI